MLDPQRAVLVERGDALLRGDELRARPVGGRLPARSARIACFAGPSFHDGSGSACAVRPRPAVQTGAGTVQDDARRRWKARLDRVTLVRSGRCFIGSSFGESSLGRRSARLAGCGRPWRWASADLQSARSAIAGVAARGRLDLLQDLSRGCSLPPPAAAGTPS